MTQSTKWCELKKGVRGAVLEQEPLSKHTSWRIGGPADVVVLPKDAHDLGWVLSYAHSREIPFYIMGNGTNLLVADRGVRGIVIKINPGLSQLRLQDCLLTAGAGVSLPRLAHTAQQAALTGFEFLAGIPGTVGGALIMNAGANNSTVGELVRQALVFDTRGHERVLQGAELNFAYRGSNLARRDLIVLEVVFEGKPGTVEEIKQKTASYLKRRRQTQPLEHPNAGSVFKNPPGDSAGRLIEEAGCKGMRVGGVEVSAHHANFFVNLGGGTARDVLNLMEQVQQRVQAQFGQTLTLEVLKLGDF